MCLRLTWAPHCHGEDRNITDILRNLFLFSDHAPHCHYPGLMALLCERTEKRQPCSAQQGLAAILLFFNMVYNDLKYKKNGPSSCKNLQNVGLTFLLDRHSLTPNRSTTFTMSHSIPPGVRMISIIMVETGTGVLLLKAMEASYFFHLPQQGCTIPPKGKQALWEAWLCRPEQLQLSSNFILGWVYSLPILIMSSLWQWRPQDHNPLQLLIVT